MSADKAMSSEMFKRNFIESYVDSLDLNDSTEKNHLMNLRRTEAQTIADDIVLATDAMLKQSGLKDRDFVFAVLNKKLEEEGYTKLVSGEGTANLSHISSILKKEIAQRVEVQKRQETENSNSISEKNFEQALMSEEQVKAKIEEMDFSKLSIYDIRLIQSNLDFALKNMDDEQIEGFTKEVFRNQDESKQEENTNVIKILKKKAMGEELSEEDQAVIETIARSRNVSPETFLEDFKAVTKFDLEISNRLETKIKSIAEEDGEITEEVIDAALEDLSEEEVDYIAKVYGYEKKTFLITRVVQVKETIEKEQGKNISTSEFFSVEKVNSIGVEDYVKDVNKAETDLDNLNLSETDTNFNFQALQDVDFTDMDYLEDIELEDETLGEEINIIDNNSVEGVFGKSMDNSEDVIENFFDNNTIEDYFDLKWTDLKDYFVEKYLKEDVNQDIKEDINLSENEVAIESTYEAPEFETKKNWIQKMQESKNPFARTIANGLMKITGKNRKALPEPQEQQEGSAKHRNFDSDGVGFDITDGNMFPSKTMALKKSIQKLFSKKEFSEKEKIPAQTIKPLTSNDFDKRIQISEEQLSTFNGESPIIPKKNDIIKNNVISTQKSYEDKDDDFEK